MSRLCNSSVLHKQLRRRCFCKHRSLPNCIIQWPRPSAPTWTGRLCRHHPDYGTQQKPKLVPLGWGQLWPPMNQLLGEKHLLFSELRPLRSVLSLPGGLIPGSSCHVSRCLWARHGFIPRLLGPRSSLDPDMVPGLRSGQRRCLRRDKY